jgi:hypothetical protein
MISLCKFVLDFHPQSPENPTAKEKEMAKVFIIQEPILSSTGFTPDLSTAAAQGTIHYIFPAQTNLAADPKHWLDFAANALAGFDPDADFILDLGMGHVDPIGPILVTLALALDQWVPSIRMLRWERNRNPDGSRSGGFYLPVTIPIDEKESKDD